MSESLNEMELRWEEWCDRMLPHERPRDTHEALRMKVAFFAGGTAGLKELERLKAERDKR